MYYLATGSVMAMYAINRIQLTTALDQDHVVQYLN